ncbi:MAG: M14 family metallopeptidase [candidate division WOR-3 bacterium]
MRNLFVIALLAAISVPVLALDRSGQIMEARVYFDNFHRLSRLGDLAGELDICTWEEELDGGYLVINTDADQLSRIIALGFRTEITWPDIREKFRFITGVDPYDIDAGRNFGYFFTYYEVSDTLDRLAANFPQLCIKGSAGLSFQGRNLWYLKISDNPAQSEGEPSCFFNGATHAREPMGTHACIAFADHILSRYGIDSVATWLVNNREIFIVPVMNPDGYVYNSDSGGSSSNWRKNRRGPVPPYVGIDLNRNYGYKWGYDNNGSSGQPSSETYRGPARFSEPETQVIRDFMALYNFRTQMDFHSYGRYNLYPWGYASTTPPERDILQEIADTLQANNGYPRSRTGQVYQTIYPCNGLSVDWEYSDTAGKFVTYAFTCELDSVDFWHGWDDSVVIRIECTRNRPNLYYLARIAGVYFDPVGVTIDDSAPGNGDGSLSPGEDAGICFTVRNRAVHPLDSAYAVSARLISADPRVVITDSVKPFPNCARRSAVNNRAAQFGISADSSIPPATVVPLRLEMRYTDAGHTHLQPVNFQITIGARVGIVQTPTALVPGFLTVRPAIGNHSLQFQLQQSLSRARLDIYSSAGLLVASLPVSGDRCDFNCSRLPAGLYFARLSSGLAAATTSFCIAR